MTISPLPASNTERWFLDYTVGGFQHTMICRAASPQVADDVASAFNAVLTELTTYLAVITIVGFRKALVGSDITNPQSAAGLESTYGTGAQGAIYAPVQTTFVGRSIDGRKARVGVFGAATLNDSSYRITAAENSEIASAIDQLGAFSAGGLFVGISGIRVLWHSYANIGLNDHFVRSMRG